MSNNNNKNDDTNVALFRSMCPAASVAEARESLAAAGNDIDLAVTLYVSSASEQPASAVTTAANAPAPNASRNKPDQQYYVGGSSSGQAVIEPGKKKTNSTVGRVNNNNAESSDSDSGDGEETSAIKSLFNKARENGAVEAGADASRNQTVAFSGHGRRLGHTEGQSPAIAPVVRNERSVKLSFYKNGFLVDDDTTLRPMDGEAEKEFLETLNRGFIPRELSQRFPGTAISVVLADHGEEMYTPPAYVAFSGSGNRLAAAVPTTAATTATSSSSAAAAALSAFS